MLDKESKAYEGMDATQAISDSILESDEEENEKNEDHRGKPLAKLCILKNEHIPEKEFPLFLGENVLGRDPSTCTLLLSAPSISKQHATISISVYRRRHAHSQMDMEALVWDRGSMNGTHKGQLKLTPNVRYALSDADSLLVADIPCRYVSCGPGAASSQADTNTIGSASSGVGESRNDSSISGLRLTVSPKLSPVRESCLLFEKTPNQQQGTLVPESDSDSENQTGGERLQKTNDSYKSSPTCSTFLSPANTTVPESEDESISTPPSSTNKRPQQHVCLSTEEKVIVNDGALNLSREEQSSLGIGTSSKGSDQPQLQEELNDIVLDESGLHDSTSGCTNAEIPVFTMDSDSDVAEGEAAPSLGNTAQQSDRPPHSLRFDIDSDTDIDEDEDVPCRSFQSVPSSHKSVNAPPAVISHIQPEGIAMSSDCDKGDNAVVSDADAATKAKSTSFQSAADGASSERLSDFHLDSDTDVDEETEQKENSDLGLIEPKPVPAVPQSSHIDSDTDDDDDLPASTNKKSTADAAVIEPHCAELDILSDSDTDVDDDDVTFPVAAVIPPQPKAAQSNSDANTDVDESAVAPVENGANPPDVCSDSDTDVEEEQVPDLQRENTPGMLTPFLLNCSTPIQLTDGEVEEMETQAFTSSSSGTFRLAPEVQPNQTSSGSNSQAEEDFIVAETQSFVLHPQDHQTSMERTKALVHDSSLDKSQDNTSREQSFQLGLSDSSHLQSHDKALASAMESPEPFPSVEVGVHLEETQAYATFSNVDNVSVDSSTDDEEEEEAMTSGVFDREEQVDMALQATQAYISASCDEPECDEEEEERQNTASTETQPMDFTDSSTLAMAETQLMVPSVEVSSLNVSSHVTFARHSEENHQKKEAQQHTLSETQPMQTTDNEDSDGGEFSSPLKEKAKSPKDEQILAETQPVQAYESQPTDGGEDVESDDDSIPKSDQRIAEPLPTQDEVQSSMSAQGCAAESKNGQNQEEDLIQGCQSQNEEEQRTEPGPSMDATCADTQPAVIDDEEEEDSQDFVLGPKKRKAKPLRIEDESQSQTSSEVCAGETQPLSQCKVEQSHEEKLNQASRKSDDEQCLEMESSKDDNVAKQRPQREKSRRDTRNNNSDQGQITRPQRGNKAKLAQGNEEKVAAQMEREVIQQKEKEEERKLQCEQVKVKKSKVLVKDKNEKDPQTPARARRGVIRTGAPLISEQPVSIQDDVPARRTRSRSNSSNSVSPERFASSSITKESKGRGRGRGTKRSSDTPQITSVRSTRRRTVTDAEPPSNCVNPPEVILTPNLPSSMSSPSRGKGGRQRGRGRRKTELVSDSHNQVISESDTNSVPPERSSRRRKTEGSYTQLSSTTRGQQQQVNISICEPAATAEESLNQEEGFSKQEPLHLKRNVRGRGQKPEKSNEEEAMGPNVRKGSDQGMSKGKGKKKDLCITTDNNDGGTEKAVESEGKVGSEFRSPAVQAKTRVPRASLARAKKEESKNPSKKEDEVENLDRRARGRSSVVPKTKKEVEEREISNIMVTQDENMEASEPPPTPTSHLSRKRRASAVSSPAAKSPRSSAALPASVSGRLRAVSQLYKVLFTGVVDEAGEKVLARLGGVMAKGVDDMNCLVTDKVRRTVKFLCAVAKGVPVVTTNWLEKSGKAGSFLDPNAFLVKDPEQEKKFSFCLSDSLKNARQQLLLQGYEIHVTKSVKPEPAHMKDIISSSGATFLSKMPSSQKPQTLVISCEEDWPLCAPALSASLPVVTAEFILTGILQQRIDFQTHKLSAPMANLQPPAGRGRSRKKT